MSQKSLPPPLNLPLTLESIAAAVYSYAVGRFFSFSVEDHKAVKNIFAYGYNLVVEVELVLEHLVELGLAHQGLSVQGLDSRHYEVM